MLSNILKKSWLRWWGDRSVPNVLLIGANGNMGRRYGAILRHLSIPFKGVDKGDVLASKHASHIIIATPTNTHYELLRYFKDDPRKILCEKPITKDERELDEILGWGDLVEMVNQYRYLDRNESCGDTIYDYFKSGGDGLPWDCINILGLSRGEVSLRNESCIWNCHLNGLKLKLSNMDMAYVRMLKEWLLFDDIPNKDYIHRAHERARQWRVY